MEQLNRNEERSPSSFYLVLYESETLKWLGDIQRVAASTLRLGRVMQANTIITRAKKKKKK